MQTNFNKQHLNRQDTMPKDPVMINVNISNNQAFYPTAPNKKHNSDGPSDQSGSAFVRVQPAKEQ